MGNPWVAGLVCLAFGVIFSAFITSLIWTRLGFRLYEKQGERHERSIAIEAETLAILRILNTDDIKAREADIGKTQRMLRTQPLGE